MGALVQLVEVGHVEEEVGTVLLQETETSQPFALTVSGGVVRRFECTRGFRYLLFMNTDCFT